MPILPPRPRNQDCHGTIVPMQGTCAASHWSDTGFTVSGADVVSMMSTLSWVISCWATWAARESLDWLSAVTISMRYFLPPMVRPFGERLPHLFQHERVRGGERRVRPGHRADEADLYGAGAELESSP